MYAIVEDSGTQIKLSTGDVLEVDVRDVDGDSITLENVLMIGGDGEPTAGQADWSGTWRPGTWCHG